MTSPLFFSSHLHIGLHENLPMRENNVMQPRPLQPLPVITRVLVAVHFVSVLTLELKHRELMPNLGRAVILSLAPLEARNGSGRHEGEETKHERRGNRGSRVVGEV